MGRPATKAFLRALERAREKDREQAAEDALQGDPREGRRGKPKPGPSKIRPKSTTASVRHAKAATGADRDHEEALGFNGCLVVVGYVTGREPFRLLGRVSADTGLPAMPDPPVTDAEMQSVAHVAKMAFAKVLLARKRKI